MRLPFRLTACLQIAVCIIGSRSALTAQQYCFNGAVTSTQGNSILRVGDPVVVTIAIRPNTTSCKSNPYLKSCSAQITLRVQSREREWTTDPNDPQDVENNKVGASASGMTPQGQGGTGSHGGTTMTFVTGAHSGPGFGVAVHAALQLPGADLLGSGSLPAAFPSPADIEANKGQFHIMVITGPDGWAEVSYMGQECASANCPEYPKRGDVVLYELRGQYLHSGVISETRCVTGKVEVTKIISKWGSHGLYEHDPNDVPFSYGQWAAYHTTTRLNNLLLRTQDPEGYVHYVTDKTYTHVELPYIFQEFLNIKPNESPSMAAAHINCDPWWANPNPPPTCPNDPGPHLYDRLTPKATPSYRYDCHGWVFAAGAVWIEDMNTAIIKTENGYQKVTAFDSGGNPR